MLFHMSSKPCISLWNQFLEGDNDAFAEIYKLTVKDLFQYGLQLTDDRDTIKDCIHDIFVKLYTNRDKLKPIDNMMAYLSIALRNSILNTLKVKRSVPYDEIEDERCDDETPETSFLCQEKTSEDKMLFNSLMSRLNDRQRQVVYYRFVQGMSITEIGNALNINYQSVSNILQRSINHLKDFSKKVSIK